MKIETCTINCIDVRIGQFDVCGPPSDTSVMPQMRQGIYEPNIQALFCALIKPGMIVCDIGANFGQHTIILSKLVGPTGKVFAIEASPINVEYIHRTVDINNCDNVKIIQCGVWSHKTELIFSHVNGAEATSFCSNKDNIREIEPNPACKYQTIKVFSLDDLIADNIDFVKIDIEGSELFAIRGAKRLLKLKSPILMELNVFTSRTFMGVEIIEIINYMESHEYNYMYIQHKGRWTYIAKDSLLNLFVHGTILIDVLFLTQQYSFGQLNSLYGMYR